MYADSSDISGRIVLPTTDSAKPAILDYIGQQVPAAENPDVTYSTFFCTGWLYEQILTHAMLDRSIAIALQQGGICLPISRYILLMWQISMLV